MKYKYYFKKPKSEIAKDVLGWLSTIGAIYIAASSPYFVRSLTKEVKQWKKYKNRKRLGEIFKRLQKQGCIIVEEKNHQIYISLTEKGKKMAGWLQVDALQIKRPKNWDGKYRIVIFDIVQLKKLYREAFRGKLKELGFYRLQDSVWVIPFDCRDEIGLLRDFFGLTHKEMRLIVAENIGPDEWLREIFKI